MEIKEKVLKEAKSKDNRFHVDLHGGEETQKHIEEYVEKAIDLTLSEVVKLIDECEVFETRQDLEQEGVEYPLIDKNELKQKLEGLNTT